MNITKLIVENSYCHKNITLNFQEGVNYITGENESGKSELLSLIYFAFVGSTALRGTADSYKNLSVTLYFKIRDTNYKVVRGSKVNLYSISLDGVETNIATSTTTVNKHITALLGYSHEIFAMTNYCAQSDAELYNRMTKSERLKFIDKASGVEEAKKIEKTLEDRKKELSPLIKSLKEILQASRIPFDTDPILEAKLEDPTIVQTLTDSIINLVSERKEIEANLTLLNNLPVQPTLDKFESMDQLKDRISVLEKEMSLIKEEGSTLDAEGYFNLLKTAFLDQRKNKEKLSKLEKDLSVGVQAYETFSLSELEEEKKKIENNKLHASKVELEKKGTITCPHCIQSFPLMHDQLSSLSEIHFQPVRITNSRDILKAENWYTVEKEKIVKTIDTLTNAIQEDQERSDKCEPYTRLYREYVELVSMRMNYQSALNYFEATLEDYKTKIVSWDKEGLESQLKQLEEDTLICSDLKHKLLLYKEKKEYAAVKQGIVVETEAKLLKYESELEVVIKTLQNSKSIKLDIQQRFIPQLNQKASAIVNEITNGKRFKLEVTPTFDLVLDGHEINLYSGSAKVIANIAFRLAYIELFYNKTFPVFIGDELDASFDPTRSQDLHNCFNTLVGRGYQIILVSHANPSQGHILNLEEIKGYTNV